MNNLIINMMLIIIGLLSVYGLINLSCKKTNKTIICLGDGFDMNSAIDSALSSSTEKGIIKNQTHRLYKIQYIFNEKNNIVECSIVWVELEI